VSTGTFAGALIDLLAVDLSEAPLSEAELAGAGLSAGAPCANAKPPIRTSAATAAFHVDLISLL
jgi:hypothetical protein